MEILEHGFTYDTIYCSECECKFTYCQKDIKTATWSEVYFKYISCPECECIIKVYNI